MRVCSSCGRENADDRDFCDCGEYLRWEPTGFMQAVTPDVVAPPPAAEPPAPAQPAPEPPPPEPEAGNGHGSPVSPGDPPSPPSAPTAVHGAVEPPPATEESDTAAITLRLPDGDAAKEDILTMGVHPGGRERLLALVRNQSGIVDNYKLSVEGLPEDWYTLYPDTVYLVPYGTSGTYEQEVEVHLHPPKKPDAEARVWELKVLADSRAYGNRAAAAPFLLGMQPYVEHETKVQPERVSGRRRAAYQVTVRNRANDVMLVGLDASDQDSELHYDFDPPMIELEPGQAQTTRMVVRPPGQIWLGRPHERRFEVNTLANEAAEAMLAQNAVPDEDEDGMSADAIKGKLKRGRGKVPVYGPRVYKPQLYKPNVYAGPQGLQMSKPAVRGPQMYGPQMGQMNLPLQNIKTPNLSGGGGGVVEGPVLPHQAVFRQKAWLPWWLAVVLPLLAMLALLLFMLMPKNTTVPKLVGLASVSDAEQKLVDAKLKLSARPAQEKLNAEVEPGTIIAQVPKEGQKAEEESEVSVVVAVGSDTVEVPDLVGKKVIDAEKTLREGKLSLGQVSPEKKPDGEVKSQIPAAGDPVKVGTPIDIFLVEPKAAGGADGKGDGKDGGEESAGGGGDLVVPAVAGQDLKAYAQTIADDGLTPEKVSVFTDKPVGAVFATEPPGGTKVKAGSTVKVLVSAGFPQLAFDDSENVLLINGANGKRLPAIAKGSQPEKDPTFSFDGTRVAFIGGRRVFLANRERPDAAPVALTSDLDEFTDIAWAPTGDANVLALVRSKGGDTDLCFGTIGSSGLSPRCIAEKDFQVGRTIHWAPGGKAVFVFGAKGQTGQFGMVRYRSKKAFSPDAGDWGKGRFVTDISQTNKGVLDLAISPDGKRMALVADTETPTPQLYLVKPDAFLLTNAKPLQVRGCKVAWRADSQEVVVVQGVTCEEATGQLVRVPIDDPTNVVALNANGDNPSYQPLTSE
jgi:beta-lactam-binding protein with PASTA domain